LTVSVFIFSSLQNSQKSSKKLKKKSVRLFGALGPFHRNVLVIALNDELEPPPPPRPVLRRRWR
jgi:hypothetical protein